ncbi:MAG: hypothetical protein QXS24_06215 [Desulfurococcaceae archaeon]
MLLNKIRSLLSEFVLFIKGLNQAILEQSVEALEAEYMELENAFLTILFGSLIGIKTTPALLSLEILHAVKEEIGTLESRGIKGEDVLGDLMASLGGEW